MDPRVKPEDDEGGDEFANLQRWRLTPNPYAFVILGLDPRIHAGTSRQRGTDEKNLSTSPKPAGQYAPQNKGANMQGKDGDKALRRIIQMLLALGQLAERAAGAWYPVRFLVLLLLRPAEAKARGFVCEMTQAPPFDLSAFPSDNSPHGALHLALCFRVLAAMLQHMLNEQQHFAAETRRRFNVVRPVMRHLIGRSPVAIPQSRAPPLQLLECSHARLHRRNGDVERFRAPGCSGASGGTLAGMTVSSRLRTTGSQSAAEWRT